jgi:hypothetical protein
MKVCHNMFALAEYSLKPVAVYPGSPVPAQSVLYEVVVVSRRNGNLEVSDRVKHICIGNPKIVE